jgi:hypothetical protein
VPFLQFFEILVSFGFYPSNGLSIVRWLPALFPLRTALGLSFANRLASVRVRADFVSTFPFVVLVGCILKNSHPHNCLPQQSPLFDSRSPRFSAEIRATIEKRCGRQSTSLPLSRLMAIGDVKAEVQSRRTLVGYSRPSERLPVERDAIRLGDSQHIGQASLINSICAPAPLERRQRGRARLTSNRR